MRKTYFLSPAFWVYTLSFKNKKPYYIALSKKNTLIYGCLAVDLYQIKFN